MSTYMGIHAIHSVGMSLLYLHGLEHGALAVVALLGQGGSLKHRESPACTFCSTLPQHRHCMWMYTDILV